MFFILLVSAFALVSAQSGPIISSPAGQIQGTIESCGLFCEYYSFKGIPYAQPPVGPLRFRNPVPYPGWSGVRDGSQHGAVCPQLDALTMQVIGDENCLFLNVYSQQIIGSRPVMVWIHGGGFSTGFGDVEAYDPRKLVPEGVVVVTINYRLGALGFLSTGDQYAQGNWGLKDCIEALRWVRSNVAAFGGNPNDVTIFGNSAGGSLVHFLYLSGMADGLFHKAIAQSGTALVPFAFQTQPKFYADRMAASLGFSTNSAVYVEQMRSVSPSSIVALQETAADIPVPRFLRPMDFVPCVEPVASPETRALVDIPMNLINSRSHQVPIMIGYNDLEGSFFTVTERFVDPTVWDQFNANPHLFVPFFWNIPQGSVSSTAVSSGFRQYYFNGAPLDWPVAFEWDRYIGDHQFVYPIDETVRVHARDAAPVYCYQFSYDGDLNIWKQLLGIPFPGATHTDELPYMFDLAAHSGVTVPPGSHALTVSSRVVRMWANFAKHGNPTPSADALLQNVIWPSVQDGSGTVPLLDIGQNLIVTDSFARSEIRLWYDLQTQYATNPFL